MVKSSNDADTVADYIKRMHELHYIKYILRYYEYKILSIVITI